MNYLSKLFDDLKQDFLLNEYAGKESLSRKIILDNDIQIIAYLSRSNMRRQIAIVFNQIEDYIKISNINGIKFELQDIFENNNMYSCMLISQSNDEYNIFEIVVNSIIQELKKLQTNNKIINVIQNSILNWKRFFERDNKIIMSENVQQGLYAELLLLEFLIKEFGEKSVFYWAGCEKELHDFYINNSAVEVKSSSIRKPYEIRISSENQLSTTDIAGNLYLYCVFLKKSSIDGENICEIIKRIKVLLKNDVSCMNEFNNKIFLAGYIENNEELYKCFFRKRDIKYYEINAGFPCIIPNNLMTGITHVQYTISIDKCSDYEINSENFRRKLGAQKNDN